MRRLLTRTATAVGILVLLVALGVVAKAWFDSRLPDSYSAMEFGTLDFGGAPATDHGSHHMVSLQTLRGPRTEPDFRATLVAKEANVRLASGRTLSAWTFNGQVPGPELRVHQGDVVEVTLANEDIEDGVTIHWHGVDVPNAEDGVAGVTQDAVMPGERHTYRFRADQVGTFWYHSHQVSSKQVRRGLYGAFIIEPQAQPRPKQLEAVALVHDFSGRTAIGSYDGVQRRPVPAGSPLRLRLVNTNNSTERLYVAGTAFRVLAIDGTELNGPTPVRDKRLVLGGGARYDVGFRMPEHSVKLAVDGYPTPRVLDAGPAEDREANRLRQRSAGLPLVRQRQALPRDADVRGAPRRPRQDADRQLERHRASDAPARAPSARPQPRWQEEHRQPVVGGHARRLPGRGVRGRLPGGQPGDLDGPLPQPPARAGRADDASRLRTDRDAVPTGRRPAQPPGVRGG